MNLKRTLMEETIRQNPEPEMYEGWLLERCLASPEATGSIRAMALELLSDWRLAQTSEVFRSWLAHGAPSDDAGS
jgi:hypothetical protein